MWRLLFSSLLESTTTTITAVTHRLHRHAWECILAFCDLRGMARAIRVERHALFAARYMKPHRHEYAKNVRGLMHVQDSCAMSRHVVFTCIGKCTDEQLACVRGGPITTLDLSVKYAWYVFNPPSYPILLQHLVHLTCIRLNDQELTMQDQFTLADVIKQSTRISTIDMSGCNLLDVSTRGEPLMRALARNTSIRTLCMNSIESSYASIDIQSLSHMLRNNSTITSLQMYRMNIGWDSIGMNSILHALQFNTSITDIHLGSNFLQDKNRVALSNMIEHNTTLRTLRLNYNEMEKASASAIARALKLNYSLKLVDLSDNYFGSHGTRELTEAVKNHKSITLLNISNNEYNNDTIECPHTLQEWFSCIKLCILLDDPEPSTL